MGPGLGATEFVLGPAGDDLTLVFDVVLDQLEQAQRPRHAVDQRHHVGAEGRLHRGFFVEVVEDDFGRRPAAFELDDEPHPAFVGLVADVGDAVEFFVADEVGDLRHQAVFAELLDRERQLGDDDRVLAAFQRLDVGPGADFDAGAAGFIGGADALAAHQAAAREVGALDVDHQAVEVDLRVVDVGHHRGADLAQVVRRDVGRHADRDPGGAVDQQVGEARRQDQRLLRRFVVVGAEVDGVGVDVAQHLGRETRHARLGVPHRRGGVFVDRAEVALAVDQRVAQGEVLRHADQRVVDRRVTVRVVFAHHLADDVGALAVRAGRLQAEVVHRVEDATMDRLQAIAHIGQRPADDHAHRVIEVRRAHLLLETAVFDVAGKRLQRH